ncbi:MAG TPA: hypothetical protein IAD31_04570 [Candidatus Enterenecus faecium]|uniref:Uncharacterized protein n=1 Tax=Candidatus Enterenecus faecium TaxID=2840780 RepID=A0A9D0YU53_9FIRM|nr:hypothetical protein [Candidatus Enterenecus faecium]
MVNSLFDKKTAKQFTAIAREKAKLQAKEQKAVDNFMHSSSMETIISVFDIVDVNGHPKEKALSSQLRNKYLQSELGFDDLMTLEGLYSSNYRFFKNKDEQE